MSCCHFIRLSNKLGLLFLRNARTVFVRNSALFVNGEKAMETFAFVTPHIDITKRLQNVEKVKEELRYRNCDFNVEKLQGIWDFYKELQSSKQSVDAKVEEIVAEIKKLYSLPKDDDVTKEISKFKLHNKILKDDLKALKKSLWSVEESAFVQALKLPNALHERTPVGADFEVIFEHLQKPELHKTHLEIGAEKNLVQYSNTQNYYLKNGAAIFELGSQYYLSRRLREVNFVQFSNPDFAKSLIVEGCGYDHTDPKSTFILQHNEVEKVHVDKRLHLTGSASLAAFFAYHAKNVVYMKSMPLKYFCIGRNYKPTFDNDTSKGLFSVSQSSALEIFVATEDTTEKMNATLDSLIELTIQIYKDFGQHFRVCYLPARELNRSESLRVSIQMFSPSSDKYVEVGNLSVSDDFISKRLLFTYMEGKHVRFPKIISGSLLNVPKALACILESSEDFSLPECCEVKNWKC